MKKLLIMTFALMAICGPAFAVSGQNLRVANICNLTDNELNEIMLGHHPEVVVEFPVQTTLPISFFLRGDLVNFVENEEGSGKLEIMQTFYVRCIEQGFILSTNLTDWKPFSEFITGTASTLLRIQDGQPFVVVGAETNYRA